jgi:hypothetical protein
MICDEIFTEERAFKFDQEKLKDLAYLFLQEKELQNDVSIWPFIPKVGREFVEIDDYEIVIDQDVTKQKLKTSKKISCRPDCACTKSIKDLGPYVVNTVSWQTECPARKGKGYSNNVQL